MKAYKSSFGVAASPQLYVKFIAMALARELSRVRECQELSLLAEKFLLVESRTMGFGFNKLSWIPLRRATQNAEQTRLTTGSENS